MMISFFLLVRHILFSRTQSPIMCWASLKKLDFLRMTEEASVFGSLVPPAGSDVVTPYSGPPYLQFGADRTNCCERASGLRSPITAATVHQRVAQGHKGTWTGRGGPAGDRKGTEGCTGAECRRGEKPCRCFSLRCGCVGPARSQQFLPHA